MLVQEVLRALDARFDVTVEEVEGPDEAVRFNLPRALTA